MNDITITDLVKHFIKRFSVTEESRVLCSYSGGADSTFLLHLLCKAREEVGFTLLAFYLNHNLRGEDSVAEEKHVLGTISSLAVPTIFYSKDIAGIAREEKVSTELCGRNLRREIIKKLTKTFELDYACTGHHRDDRVETYLFNTFRGSGLRGLTTMKEQDGKVIRPLLELSKGEILSFLKKEGISFCEDQTNQENEYSRNRIRNIILPAVREQINPEVEKTISRNILVLEEYETTVNTLVLAFTEKYVTEVENYLYISDAMKNDPLFTPLIIKEVFRKLLQRQQLLMSNLSFSNFESVLELFLREKQEILQMPVPGGATAFFGSTHMVLIFQGEFERLAECSYTLSSPSAFIEEPYFKLFLKPFEGEPERIFPLTFPVKVRGRKPGDRVFLGGHASSKKTKKILIDKKIPSYEKVFHPVIDCGSGNNFLAGIGMEGFAFESQQRLYGFSYSRGM